MGNKVRIERICEFCGKTFIAKTCKTRFCCKACNDKYYKELIRSDRYNAVTKEVKEEKKKRIIIRKSKFPQNPKRSVRFSGKRTKRSVQKRKARNTQKAETKVL